MAWRSSKLGCTELASVFDDELKTPEADGAFEDSERHVDAEGRKSDHVAVVESSIPSRWGE